MKALKLIVVLFVFLSSNVCKAQPKELIQIIDNTTFKFRAFRQSPIFNDSIISVEPIIAIHAILSDSAMGVIKKIKQEDWVLLLKNLKTDWAANLLLYEIFKKDGIRFKVIKTREEWVRTYREDDINFWLNKFLKDPG